MTLLLRYRTTAIKKGVLLSWTHAIAQLHSHNFVILHLNRARIHTARQLFEAKPYASTKLQTWIIAASTFPITTAPTMTVSVAQYSKDSLAKSATSSFCVGSTFGTMSMHTQFFNVIIYSFKFFLSLILILYHLAIEKYWVGNVLLGIFIL
jgi:hypothetical protein